MASTTGIRGRFFATLLKRALEFYMRHKNTIDPYIASVAISALTDLVAMLPGIIDALNPPGPG